MGNVITSVPAEGEIPLGSGLKVVFGTIKMSTSYATGGDALNLVNYFSNSGAAPIVVFSGGSNVASTEFYVPAHNGGSIAEGKVRLVAGSAAAGETKLLECNNAKDASSINVGFMAIARQF